MPEPFAPRSSASSVLPAPRAVLPAPRAVLACAVACLALGAAILLLCASPALASGKRAHRAPARRAPLSVPASLAIASSQPGQPVPRGFLGLSFEVASLAQLASWWDEGDLVGLLRSLGPGMLRFGGVSADHDVAWRDAPEALPAWASQALEPAQLAQLAQLAASSGWPVLLTLDLDHYEPQVAASESAAAKALLGPWLQAIEIGNEPDGYVLQGARLEPWSFSQYDEEIAIYRGAIEAAAPGLALAGPDTYASASFGSWGVGETLEQRPALLTGHQYPLGCTELPAPSIARLLSAETREVDALALHRYMHVAELSEIPFRMDETNSVSCGGVAGVSNTFASALWAVSYVSQVMAAGAAGINLEGNPANCGGYTPLCARSPEALAQGQLSAQPEWYALLLLRALVGDRPLPSSLQAPASTNLSASCFIAPNGELQIAFVDNDPPRARPVALRLPVGAGFRGASVLALSAAAPGALYGVRLGGREVERNGSWAPPARLPFVAQRHGAIQVRIPPSSAALISILP